MTKLFYVLVGLVLVLSACSRNPNSGESSAQAKDNNDSLKAVDDALDQQLDTAAAAALPDVRIRELLQEGKERYDYVVKGGKNGYRVKDPSGIGVYIALGPDLNSEEKLTKYLAPVYSKKTIEDLIEGFDLKIRLKRYTMVTPIDIKLPDLSRAKIKFEYANGRVRQYRIIVSEGEVLVEFHDNGGGNWRLAASAAEIAMAFASDGEEDEADKMTEEELIKENERLRKDPLTQDDE